VTGKQFPQSENWFGIKDDQYDELVGLLESEDEEAVHA
jgi:hypothetical protein